MSEAEGSSKASQLADEAHWDNGGRVLGFV